MPRSCARAVEVNFFLSVAAALSWYTAVMPDLYEECVSASVYFILRRKRVLKEGRKNLQCFDVFVLGFSFVCSVFSPKITNIQVVRKKITHHNAINIAQKCHSTIYSLQLL